MNSGLNPASVWNQESVAVLPQGEGDRAAEEAPRFEGRILLVDATWRPSWAMSGAGRQGAVDFPILCGGPCAEELKEAQTLVRREAIHQGENVFRAQWS